MKHIYEHCENGKKYNIANLGDIMLFFCSEMCYTNRKDFPRRNKEKLRKWRDECPSLQIKYTWNEMKTTVFEYFICYSRGIKYDILFSTIAFYYRTFHFLRRRLRMDTVNVRFMTIWVFLSTYTEKCTAIYHEEMAHFDIVIYIKVHLKM